LEQRPGSLRVALDKLRSFAISRLTGLRKLISQPDSVHRARALLAEEFGTFVMTPVVKNGKATYAVQGEIGASRPE